MQEALKVIKRELGPEAIILSTKHIKSGFGLMSKASVEVTAAIAEKDLKKKMMAEKGLPDAVKEKIWNGKATKQAEIYDDYFEKQLKRAAKDKVEIGAAKQRSSQRDDAIAKTAATFGTREDHQMRQAEKIAQPTARTQQQAAPAPAARQAPSRIGPSAQPAPATERRYVDIMDDDSSAPAAIAAPQPRQIAVPAADSTKVKSLEADIEQLKSMIVELASGATTKEDGEGATGMTEEAARVMQELAGAGIEKKLARQIVRQVSFDLSPSEQNDEQAILDKVAAQLISEIQVADVLEQVGARAGKSTSTVMALVGPTGVGKTTTIAKIASLAILEKRLRVGLINLDSYKVAAADQLATYAKIMNVPFRSVNTRDELTQAIYDFSSLDLVLIDTTGRSQKDQESLLQLRHMLASIEGVQSVLLMSATTKDSDMNEVVSRFKIFHPVGLVFSKLDETSVYGCIYNTQKRTGLPLLYFTVGQRVPEDIEKASAERVVDLVLDL